MDKKTEVKSLLKRLEGRDTNKIREQKTDLSFYEDTFEVDITSPFHVIRTGKGARIINDMVSHIQIANPQVFREKIKASESGKESALKVEKFLNYLVRSIIGEIKESIWMSALFGEGLFQVDFNGDAYENSKKGYVHRLGALPVIVSSIDPLIAHCLPYDSLLPEKVIKKFEMDSSEIINMFPEWANPKNRKEGSSNGAKYIAYWDADSKYYEADEETLEEKLNIFGFCPFVHFYSGFGMKSSGGKPENLAVGRLRRIRGRLIEHCEIESRIDSIIGLYANPIYRIKKTQTDAEDADVDSLKDIVLGPGATLYVPYGYEDQIYTPEVASAQLFAHLAQIERALEVESPSLLSGFPQTSKTTGRQEDIEYSHIQRKYASLIFNLEESLEAVLGMCLKILDTVPQALPVNYKAVVEKDGQKVEKTEDITKEDINGNYDCDVKLNPDEDLEDTIDFQKYRMLVSEGRISWKEFLIKGCKKTESEAEDIMADAIAEQTIMTNPQMQLIRVQEALERMGAQKYLKILEQQAQEQTEMNQALQTYTPKEPRPSEARNPTAAGVLRQVLNETPQGIRRPVGAAGV
jgi:hypothetical protein